MQFTKHALDRIRKGDKHGLRTVLTPEEIVEHIESGLGVEFNDVLAFYSQKDADCVGVVLGTDGCAVTILRGSHLDYTHCIRAEFKAGKTGAMDRGPLPPIESWKRSSAVLFYLRYFDVSAAHKVLRAEWSFMTVLDFKGSFFRNEGFLKMLASGVEAVQEEFPPRNYLVKLGYRGAGFSHQLPVDLPSELIKLGASCA